jgi:hypothetical protein
MKTLNCIKTGLMAAFRAQDVDPGMFVEEPHWRNLGKRLSLSGNSTNCGHGVRAARSHGELCALHKAVH